MFRKWEKKKSRFVPKYFFTPSVMWCLRDFTVLPHLLSNHMSPITLFSKCLHPLFSITPLRESPEVDLGTVSVVQVLLCFREAVLSFINTRARRRGMFVFQCFAKTHIIWLNKFSSFVLLFFSETTSLPAVTSEMQQTIEKRIANYRTAISNAKESGESVKLRRYERGLKVSWIHKLREREGGKICSLRCSSVFPDVWNCSDGKEILICCLKLL